MTGYKRESEFLPWEDEEGRKKKPERGDSIPPNTSAKSRLRSKPKGDGQEYLDMYILSKQKERVEKYGTSLAKQQKNVATEWKGVKKELVQTEIELPRIPRGGMEESEEEPDTEAKQKKKIPGHMKKMDWDY